MSCHQVYKQPLVDEARGSATQVSLEAPALEKIHVTAHYCEIKFKDVPFEGLVQYNLSNGASFAQKARGYYIGIYNCYTSIKVKKTTVAKYKRFLVQWLSS